MVRRFLNSLTVQVTNWPAAYVDVCMYGLYDHFRNNGIYFQRILKNGAVSYILWNVTVFFLL